MKSNSIRGVAGNVKCRGKIEKMLSCGCCNMKNFKWTERVKEAIKQIKNYDQA